MIESKRRSGTLLLCELCQHDDNKCEMINNCADPPYGCEEYCPICIHSQVTIYFEVHSKRHNISKITRQNKK